VLVVVAMQVTPVQRTALMEVHIQVVAAAVGLTFSPLLFMAAVVVLALSLSAHQKRLLQLQAPQQSQPVAAELSTNSTLLAPSLSKAYK
jgi:hypothetical protein